MRPILPSHDFLVNRHRDWVFIFAATLTLLHCSSGTERTLIVTATAFNSIQAQTDSTPALAAWGDILTPGMKAVAVSRDLLDEGLSHGSKVGIDGLPGEYVVLDKMAKRMQQKIDIYMGDDVDAARDWGKKEVRIRWKTRKAQEGE